MDYDVLFVFVSFDMRFTYVVSGGDDGEPSDNELIRVNGNESGWDNPLHILRNRLGVRDYKFKERRDMGWGFITKWAKHDYFEDAEIEE